MSFFNCFYESYLHVRPTNYILQHFKRAKFNLKYRKVHLCCKLRKPALSDINECITPKVSDSSSSFVTFDNMIENRRNEAKRSIGVQVQSEGSGMELFHYCREIAPVNSMFYYTLNNNHYFLVEFEEKCNDVLDKCIHTQGTSIIPTKSPFVWFKASKHGAKFHKTEVQTEFPLKESIVPTEKMIKELIENSETLTACIKVLHEGTRLDELGTRLRFLTARQIEMALEGLFPNIAALPFGSTVNGLGKAGCDLDLVLQHDFGQAQNNHLPSRLVQHHKNASSSSGSRQHIQRQMEVIADLIQLYLPGCNSVKRILQARVPIVKYSHEVTGVECDLSMTNMTGVYMSELLYLMGSLDPMAKPLVFTIKQWAWATGLTNPTPGRWITNFTITLLTVFYLQVINRLPSINILRATAEREDKRITEEIDCTFIRDITRLKWKPKKSVKKQQLSHLLKGFFDYYTNFDFSTSGISLGAGKCIPKPDFSPLYVVNPLEQSANVSKNVSLEEMERIRITLRDASWTLETIEDHQKTFINFVTKPSDMGSSTRKYVPNTKVSIKRLFNDG